MFKNFKDLEKFSEIEKSEMSTFRKVEEEKRQKLFKIVDHKDIEKLKIEIQGTISNN